MTSRLVNVRLDEKRLRKARALRKKRSSCDEDVCSMCSSFCAMKVVEEYLGKPGGRGR